MPPKPQRWIFSRGKPAALTVLQVLNTGRLARCVQEDAQEAVAGMRSAQHQLADRLATLERAVESLPRDGARLTVNVRL